MALSPAQPRNGPKPAGSRRNSAVCHPHTLFIEAKSSGITAISATSASLRKLHFSLKSKYYSQLFRYKYLQELLLFPQGVVAIALIGGLYQSKTTIKAVHKFAIRHHEEESQDGA